MLPLTDGQAYQITHRTGVMVGRLSFGSAGFAG